MNTQHRFPSLGEFFDLMFELTNIFSHKSMRLKSYNHSFVECDSTCPEIFAGVLTYLPKPEVSSRLASSFVIQMHEGQGDRGEGGTPFTCMHSFSAVNYPLLRHKFLVASSCGDGGQVMTRVLAVR